MEDFILDTVTFIGNVDFSLVLRMFLYVYLFFWIMVVIWVWFDASERSSNVPFKIFAVFVTFLLNIFGLLIYLLVRPVDSYEERYLNELEKKYLQLETSGIMQCPECNFDLEPGFVVCPRCGVSVKVKCESCGEYIDSHWEFCAYCGVERNVSVSLRENYAKKDNEEKVVPSRDYYSALSKCFLKVGERQKQCIQRTKDFFDNSLKKKMLKKSEMVEEKLNLEAKKKKKDKKKAKKRKRRK